MKETDDNLIASKSKAFALRCIKAYQYLTTEKKEYVLSKQLLRSGTSIGANVKEGLRGQTKPDFASKMSIALKEASETEYWIELLNESGILSEKESKSLHDDCVELIRILTTIVKSAYDAINNKEK
ncbi:MAG: four helix bundle protein [Bacteroidaceae bacterium]|nr:four helix bundle protein [Bacteroidaceae bacterium]